MISDFIKGKKQFDYPDEVQKGIRLHRMIDRFTDDHAATAEAKEYFRPQYRLYSGAFVDIVYDHFLANDETIFGSSSLASFSQVVYQQLYAKLEILPYRFAMMLPYMRDQDWLFNYRTTWGIRNSFGGLARRATYIDDSAAAYQIFIDHYEALSSCYRSFIPNMLAFAKHEFDLLSLP